MKYRSAFGAAKETFDVYLSLPLPNGLHVNDDDIHLSLGMPQATEELSEDLLALLVFVDYPNKRVFKCF